MRIEISDERPPVSPDELAAAEARLVELGHPIPPSYRAFLADQEGGKPVRNYFSFRQGDRDQHDRVRVFYGIAESPNGDLVEEAEGRGDRVLAGLLPIAGDGDGNLVVLDGRGGRDGPVYFWDHEFEGEPPDASNLWWLTPDLETFLADLIENATRRPRSTSPRAGGACLADEAFQKAQGTARGLSNWLRRKPGASPHDRRVAQSRYDELVDVLGPHR